MPRGGLIELLPDSGRLVLARPEERRGSEDPVTRDAAVAAAATLKTGQT